MDATDVTEVCRLCPSSGGGQGLLNIFDGTISFKYNIKEVILMYTGIEILDTDLVSKKICQRCCNILYKMYEFRLDALKQDRKLKDKCGQYLGDKGIRLPNTCVTIKKEKYDSSLTDKKIKQESERIQPLIRKEDLKKMLHHLVAEKPSTASASIGDLQNKLHSITEKPLKPSTSRDDLQNKLHSITEKPSTIRGDLQNKFLSITEKPSTPSTSRGDLQNKFHSITENPSTPSTSRGDFQNKFHSITDKTSTSVKSRDLKTRCHPSVADIRKKYPNYKIPERCYDRHIAPVVSLGMNEVEIYFKQRKLNLKKFIYKPRTKPEAGHKVAKKRPSLPTKPKTVAPLKISKKLFEYHGGPGTSTDNYLPVPTESISLKRKTSSDGDRNVIPKLSRNNQPKSSTSPQSSIGASKPTNINSDVVKTLQPVLSVSNGISETIWRVRTPSPKPTDLLSDNSRTPSPAAFDNVYEDSTDTESTNTSKASKSSSAYKPKFMESFGLTPTVTATKSHTLVVCSLCGSVHHNAFELKRHTSTHRVCQFCKMKFKSVEAKVNHVDNVCQIKKVMNSSGPIVELEKTHLNLDIRKKYRNAFANFDLIPGLIELTPVEQVILQAASPPPPDADDAVIVLSDDEDETPTRSADPLSGIPTPSANMPPPAVENVVYSTVSIVRPDIRIKNNTILNSLVENTTDKDLIKKLIELFKPPQPTTVEKMLQTGLPLSKDIKINNSEGTCEFKNLKGHLATYKIPITISNGTFHASYRYNGPSETNKGLALWDDLPVIDSRIDPSTELSGTSANTVITTPTSSSVETSQAQILNVAVSAAPVVTSVTTQSSIIPSKITNEQMIPAVPSSSAPITTMQTTILNRPLEVSYLTLPVTNTAPINTSNSATPLLQNYALSMTSSPLIINPIPIPRTYINSALNNTVSTSNRISPSATGNNIVSRPLLLTVTTSYSRPEPANAINVNRSMINTPSPVNSFLATSRNPPNSTVVLNPPNSTVVLNPPPANGYSTNISLPVTTAAPMQPTDNVLGSISGTISNATTSISETTTKFRVKSVWELQ